MAGIPGFGKWESKNQDFWMTLDYMVQGLTMLYEKLPQEEREIEKKEEEDSNCDDKGGGGGEEKKKKKL